MRLVVSIFLAITLLITGAPHSSWSDNHIKIAAYAGDANTFSFREMGENYIDDRILVAFPLASETSLSDSVSIVSTSIRRTSEEKNSTKEDLKIYKLTAAFLI